VAWRRDDKRWLYVGVADPSLGRLLVDHPVLASGAVGTVMSIIPLLDRPIEWSVVLTVFAFFAGVIGISAAMLRRRVRQLEFDPTAGPVGEPKSNVHPAPRITDES
jgi:hypothetical protein